MRNVWKIIKDDFRLVCSNVISIVVVLGLIAVPGMYVWFNLIGLWDPYNNIDNLEVAIVNQDEGYKSELLPIDLKLGSSVEASLRENKGLKWDFTNYDQAMEKLSDGLYYAVIVIPSDFSKQLLSIINGDVESATLIYYSNEKNNPIAPKITGKGALAIQQKFNSSFSNTIYSVLLKTASNVLNIGNSNEAASVGKNLNILLTCSSEAIDNVITQTNSIKAEINDLKSIIVNIRNKLLTSDSSELLKINKTLDTVKNDVKAAKESVSYIISLLKQFGIDNPTINSLYDLIVQVESSVNSCYNIVDKSIDAQNSLLSTITSLENLLNNVNMQIEAIENTFTTINDDVKFAKDKLLAISSSSTIEDVKKLIGNDTNKLSSLLTTPVQLSRNAVFPMSNNASSMSGFYISICVWVGSLILAALLKSNLTKQRKEKFKDKNLKNWQIYLGRYVIFGVVSLLQITFIISGCIFFLKIQIAHPFLLMLTGWLVSICYSLFIYTLLASFGSIGKAMCVILLVLQIAATGGTFPIPLVAEPFQSISPWLPTTYSLRAINMCVAGFTNSDLLVCVLLLCLSMIPISLILGLILRNPIIKLNEKFKEKVSSAKILSI